MNHVPYVYDFIGLWSPELDCHWSGCKDMLLPVLTEHSYPGVWQECDERERCPAEIWEQGSHVGADRVLPLSHTILVQQLVPWIWKKLFELLRILMHCEASKNGLVFFFSFHQLSFMKKCPLKVSFTKMYSSIINALSEKCRLNKMYCHNLFLSPKK